MTQDHRFPWQVSVAEALARIRRPLLYPVELRAQCRSTIAGTRPSGKRAFACPSPAAEPYLFFTFAVHRISLSLYASGESIPPSMKSASLLVLAGFLLLTLP